MNTDQDHTLEDRIRAVAHSLWLEEGQPEGRADEHWRLASEAVAREEADATHPLLAAPASAEIP